MSIIRELGGLKEGRRSDRGVHIDLQHAFLRTFPKNVCLAADEDLEYPFYVMIRDKNLLKVHGTSIVSRLAPKPKWTCCQNLVLSSITGRPMAKLLVPIDEGLLKSMDKVMYKQAKKMDEERLPQKETLKNSPSAVLRFYRAKNHNEEIQKELKLTKAYLETDEEKDSVLYFYLKDLSNPEGKKREMVEMIERMEKYVAQMMAKRHHLFSVSDRTKMHVDENGKIVDVLGSQEFLTFVVKTVSPDVANRIEELREQLKVEDKLFHISTRKDKNLMMVSVNNKVLSGRLFEYTSRFCRKLSIGCIFGIIRFPNMRFQV